MNPVGYNKSYLYWCCLPVYVLSAIVHQKVRDVNMRQLYLALLMFYNIISYGVICIIGIVKFFPIDDQCFGEGFSINTYN